MKYEDMTKEQLVEAVRGLHVEIANLRLSNELAWDRYEQANKMTKSYIDEFEARGLMHIPKIPKEVK
jgi:hypothetical protein